MNSQTVEALRRSVSETLDPGTKAALGQFLTPLPIARFMASLFPTERTDGARLLDAGAGIGSLSAAFVDRWLRGEFAFTNLDVRAYEIDPDMRKRLSHIFGVHSNRSGLSFQIISGDFVETAVNMIQFGQRGSFTHAILNPPYGKIRTDSDHRLLIRQVGIETVNIYSAFVALAIELVEAGGFIVAIIPRSFCNGPYYRPFREFVLTRTALKHIHIFGSRRHTFKDDNVLQENIIIMLERGGIQEEVTISSSDTGDFSDITWRNVPFNEVVVPGDAEFFIHIDASPEINHQLKIIANTGDGLKSLCLAVSTGPVVDFRLKHHLRAMPEPGTVPLLYANHFRGGNVVWPLAGKKPNAIMETVETFKWLMPNGFYTVVRRLSAKEERRRVVAFVHDPTRFPDAKTIGFENHLNVFHRNKAGLDPTLAHGLSVYLNSTAVDRLVRTFSGHTQVNATDLRSLPYPDMKSLMRLGEWAMGQSAITQLMIDSIVESVS
jgi:predicted RNA methylase